jgi:hypothetical protein
LHNIVIKQVDNPIYNCDLGVPLLYKAWRPCDSLFDFRVFVRASKPDFPRTFCSTFKLFDHQNVRNLRFHCISNVNRAATWTIHGALVEQNSTLPYIIFLRFSLQKYSYTEYVAYCAVLSSYLRVPEYNEDLHEKYEMFTSPEKNIWKSYYKSDKFFGLPWHSYASFHSDTCFSDYRRGLD